MTGQSQIESFSHDEFLAECQRRCDIGQFGEAGLMSTAQTNARANWQELYLWLATMGCHSPVMRKMEEIINRNGPPRRIAIKGVHRPGMDTGGIENG